MAENNTDEEHGRALCEHGREDTDEEIGSILHHYFESKLEELPIQLGISLQHV
ncbi:hypothetical protein D3C76_1540880 [compost metagenome]